MAKLTPHNPPTSIRAMPGFSVSFPLVLFLLLLAAFAAVVCCLPLATAVKIGADEDFELSKAVLLNHGYQPYTQIWNDQPPLVTDLIAGILKHVSTSILAPRLLVGGFSLLLLGSLFCLVRRVQSALAGAIAVAILIASPGYLELSVSCMQEILVLAPLVASLACLASGGVRTRWLMTGIGAAVFGFALQMKLIGFMYFPLALLVIGLREWTLAKGSVGDTSMGQRWPNAFTLRRLVGSSILFSAVALAAFVALNYSTGSSLILQLKQGWAAHFSQARSFEYGAPADHPFDWAILLRNWDATLPALVGVTILVRRVRREPWALIPLAWLLLTFAAFSTHVPWWTYYYVHNSIPLAWCAAVGWIWVAEAVSRQSKAVIVLSVAVSLCLAAWMCGRVYLQVQSIRKSPKLSSSLVLKEIARYKPFTEFLFADEPIYSFHSGIPMPPHLAVISLKRLWSGDMTPAKLRSEMEQTKPGLILLNNDTQELPFQDLIDTEYRMCYQDARHRLFVLRSISRKPFE